MNEAAILRGDEPRKILQTVIEEKVPAIMSYLSGRKWHAAKVLLTELGANRLSIKVSPTVLCHAPRPMNILVNQPVGISLKYEYGKFIFETKVIGLEPSPEATNGGTGTPFCNKPQNGNPTIVLAVPDQIEIVQRRSYFRVEVPAALKVNVVLWHRRKEIPVESSQSSIVNHQSCWQGKLVDISAGGAQIVVDAAGPAQRPGFRKGQFIGLAFTPMPYETPLELSAQIRNILPTADGKSICLGLQIVGLEASSAGQQILHRLCSVVERYFQINQSSAKQQDMQTTRS